MSQCFPDSEYGADFDEPRPPIEVHDSAIATKFLEKAKKQAEEYIQRREGKKQMSNLKMVLAGGSVLWFAAAVAELLVQGNEQGAILSVLCGILFHLWAVA